MLPIEAESRKALAERERSPGRHDITLKELRARPRYWGWVEAAALQGVPFRMFLGGNDGGVELRLFWNGQYERMTLALWALTAGGAGLAVDIGAHTGVYSLAAWAMKPGGVLSFEPHFMNFARLNLNLRANGYPTRLSSPLAVSDRVGLVPFSIDTTLDYLSAGGRVGARSEAMTFPVQACRLDGQLDSALWPRISVIKIDTEGHEDEVLRGGEQLIARARPDLFVECIDREAGAKLTARLGALGYGFYLIDDRAAAVAPVAKIAPELGADGAPLMHRLNRLATRRAPEQVQALADEARARLP